MSQPTALAEHAAQPARASGPSNTAAPFRNGHLNLDTFSPVNQNGSFEFDRILKSGKVYRRVKNKHASPPQWSLLMSSPQLTNMADLRTLLEARLPRPPAKSVIGL